MSDGEPRHCKACLGQISFDETGWVCHWCREREKQAAHIVVLEAENAALEAESGEANRRYVLWRQRTSRLRAVVRKAEAFLTHDFPESDDHNSLSKGLTVIIGIVESILAAMDDLKPGDLGGEVA